MEAATASVPGFAEPVRADIFRVGEVLARAFEVTGVLGSGGMGQVFEAIDLSLGRPVAVKAAWPHLGKSVLDEARAIATIRHPGVPVVFGTGEHEGTVFVVMERISGKTLEAYATDLRSAGKHLSVPEVVDIAVKLAEALEAVHDAGLVHRDVKPGNIMMAPGGRVVLMDFGLYLTEAEMKTTGDLSGTPDYMAPEAFLGDSSAGRQVDHYALGVLLHRLLADDLPFPASTPLQAMHQHLLCAPPDVRRLRRDVPARLATLVRELLAKAPDDRPADMHGVALRLRNVLAGPPDTQASAFEVLIVDDDADLRRMLETMVARTFPDARVRTADDAEQALAMFTNRPPDVLLVDLGLPRMSGVELCMHVLGSDAAERTTLLPMSAAHRPSDIALLERLGIDRFIEKGGSFLANSLGALRDVHGRLQGG